MSTDSAVVVRDLTKEYGATVALGGVSARFRSGRVTAVVGANGSGKTTLLSVISGLVAPTSGTVTGPDGARLGSLRAAQRAGVVLVPQEPTVAGHLPVWQNVALGRPAARRGWLLDDAGARRFALRHLTGLLPEAVLEAPTAQLSKSDRQLVQLAAALGREPAVLLLDEPTAVLDEDGVVALHGLVRRFTETGGTVVIVSHRLRDVLELADDVLVLRNGLLAHAGAVTEATEKEVVKLLSAADREGALAGRGKPGQVVLSARELRGWRGLHIERLEVRAGEIVGIAGQSGSGRSRLAAVLAGAFPATGDVRVGETRIELGRVASARAAGVAYIPEDRQVTAILANQSVAANLLLGDVTVRRGPFRSRSGERAAAAELIDRFEVRPPDPGRVAGLLSGGNQQKLVVARALSRNARVVIADEPTQGVDASARGAIHEALIRAAGQGAGVLAVCSDFEELFELADRVIVVRDGRLVLDRATAHVSQDEVLAASLGADPEVA